MHVALRLLIIGAFALVSMTPSRALAHGGHSEKL
jgi:hypothetical protein